MSYVVTISGSPAARSRSTHLLSEAEALLQARGIATRRIDPRALPAEALLHADFGHPAIREALELVEHAQAVVIATPVYKVAYSGLLKTFLDLLPQTGLTGKLVLPIATGGSLAHLLALDYSLKPVISSLGARHVLANVFATDVEIASGQGGYETGAVVTERLVQSIDQLSRVWSDQVELREHRERRQRDDARPFDATSHPVNELALNDARFASARAVAAGGGAHRAVIQAPVPSRCPD
jgi:FMN reductase